MNLEKGPQLYDLQYKDVVSYITNTTTNSVEVFLPKRSAAGINCTGWFSCVEDDKGRSEFNKRFSLDFPNN